MNEVKRSLKFRYYKDSKKSRNTIDLYIKSITFKIVLFIYRDL